jgi:hypothetical protein
VNVCVDDRVNVSVDVRGLRPHTQSNDARRST